MSRARTTQAQKEKDVRILLVDDHPMIRERLADVIRQEADLVVCGEAEDQKGAMAAVKTNRPDLAIVDLALKQSHGLELIKDMRSHYPELVILVVSMHDESLHAERVIRAGARGYITKQEATKNILQAIRTVLAGEIYLSKQAALRLATRVAGVPLRSPGPELDQLTDRELRVLELIGQGHGTRQIAEMLGLGVPTIETYRARIKDKLHLRDATELLHYAIRHAQGEGG
jgi:DNA-binding NarL/FixJ family response regulator